MPEDRKMPNAALRTLFLAMEEVMGENVVNIVLKQAGLERFIGNYPPNNVELDVNFSDYGHAEQAVEDFYGPRGARTTLVHIGRATFQYGLKEQPAILGVAGMALKLLPLHTKMKMTLDRLAAAATKDVNQPAHVEETDDAFIFVAEECPCRHRPPRSKPCCFVTVGVLHEAMNWATEKRFNIKEFTCIAKGDDACRYRIDKEPMD